MDNLETLLDLQRESIRLSTQAMQIFQRKWGGLLPPEGQAFLASMIANQGYAPLKLS